MLKIFASFVSSLKKLQELIKFIIRLAWKYTTKTGAVGRSQRVHTVTNDFQIGWMKF
jgi:hypothetical protein